MQVKLALRGALLQLRDMIIFFIKLILYILAAIGIAHLMNKLARPYMCEPNESGLACVRQWQGLISAMIALFAASVTWRYSKAAIDQSVRIATFNRMQIIGDRCDEDIRALEKFEEDFLRCKIEVQSHFEDESQPLKGYVEQKLRDLKFPPWPTTQWENYFNHCIEEFRQHYFVGISKRLSAPKEFNEHYQRIIGIHGHLWTEIKNIKKERVMKHDKEFENLRFR